MIEQSGFVYGCFEGVPRARLNGSIVLPDGPCGGVVSGDVKGSILGHSRLIPGHADVGSVGLGCLVVAGNA